MSRSQHGGCVIIRIKHPTPSHGLSNVRLQTIILRNGVGHCDHNDNTNNNNNGAGCWRLISHDAVNRERRGILLNSWRC